MKHVAIIVAAMAAVHCLPNPSLNIAGNSRGESLDSLKLPGSDNTHGVDINMNDDGIGVEKKRTVAVENKDENNDHHQNNYNHNDDNGNSSSNVNETSESDKSHKETNKHVETEKQGFSLNKEGLTGTKSQKSTDERHVKDHEKKRNTYSRTDTGNGTYHKVDHKSEHEKDMETHDKHTKNKEEQWKLGLGGMSNNQHETSAEEHHEKTSENGSSMNREEDYSSKNGKTQHIIRGSGGKYAKSQENKSHRETEKHKDSNQTHNESKDHEKGEDDTDLKKKNDNSDKQEDDNHTAEYMDGDGADNTREDSKESQQEDDTSKKVGGFMR